MSKKTAKKTRSAEAGDAATERCARCVTRTAAKQVRQCERYWSHTFTCSACGAIDQLNEVWLLQGNNDLQRQLYQGQPKYFWRCPLCTAGELRAVEGLPPRLVRFLESIY